MFIDLRENIAFEMATLTENLEARFGIHFLQSTSEEAAEWENNDAQSLHGDRDIGQNLMLKFYLN